ncbi:Nuclear receptor-binding protein [Trichoplax sp. H2]|nr:Nuclear receptor-binding protein [Trichoplax sp. H2]|eukprot:RDD46170.1 Nuclear receptor-binding protein [Trichoplax sp. H2]
MAATHSLSKSDTLNPQAHEELSTDTSSRPDSGDESDDENKVLEESPNGRYKKQKRELVQHGSLGTDAFLGMDTDEGVEIVWNEIWLSEGKSRSFYNHNNIVEFYHYWTHNDEVKKKARITFITEYMTSGSLKQFLKKTKKNQKGLLQEKLFKRWCRQILSALDHLASFTPPIIHGNLSLDTIYIQHNGLIKIGSVIPEAISYHAKSRSPSELQNLFTAAPEYDIKEAILTTSVDIYAFGICALEIATQFFDTKSGKKPSPSMNYWNRGSIQNSLESLENTDLLKFLQRCLQEKPEMRPSAKELLLDKFLFEVHSLKLQAAHTIVDKEVAIPEDSNSIPLAILSQMEGIAADISYKSSDEPFHFGYASGPPALDLEKYIEEVRSGLYPLTSVYKDEDLVRDDSDDKTKDDPSIDSEHYSKETKSVLSVNCTIRAVEDDEVKRHLVITLKMENEINRELSCDVSLDEDLSKLAEELVLYGFIKQDDREKVAQHIAEKLKEPNLQA